MPCYKHTFLERRGREKTGRGGEKEREKKQTVEGCREREGGGTKIRENEEAGDEQYSPPRPGQI